MLSDKTTPAQDRAAKLHARRVAWAEKLLDHAKKFYSTNGWDKVYDQFFGRAAQRDPRDPEVRAEAYVNLAQDMAANSLMSYTQAVNHYRKVAKARQFLRRTLDDGYRPVSDMRRTGSTRGVDFQIAQVRVEARI